MQCPYLREVQGRECRLAALRKQILRTPAPGERERCTSGDYEQCPLFQRPPSEASQGRCPYLTERLMQYCAAAPVEKLVPYTESLLSRCGTDRYRYCDLYLSLLAPQRSAEAVDAAGIAVPPRLSYTRNHMWFDPGEGDTYHIGLDGLLAKLLGRVEEVLFITVGGSRRPAVSVKARGAELQLVFPHELPIGAVHAYLRARPETITEDPYGRGWLFEGPATATPPGLLSGDPAVDWMRHEVGRMNQFAHACAVRRSPTLLADGGEFSGDLLAHLDREEVLRLFHEFFSPYRND